MLEPGDQRDDRFLNVAGKTGGDAVAVVFQGVAAFGFEEDLVGLAIGEPDHLVLDGRTVPGPGGLDLSAVHRSPVQVCPDDVMNGRIGRGDVAIELVLNDPVGQERERDRFGVSRLRFQAGEIDGPAVEPGRRSGLEPAELETEAEQAAGKSGGRRVASPPAGRLDLAGVHQGLEERPGGQHDRTGLVTDAPPAGHAGDTARVHVDRFHHLLAQREVGLPLDGELRQELIGLLVALGPRAVHRRALAPVEQAELDRGGIGEDRPSPRPAHRSRGRSAPWPLRRSPDCSSSGPRCRSSWSAARYAAPSGPPQGPPRARRALRLPRQHRIDRGGASAP